MVRMRRTMREYLQNGADFVLVGEAEQSLVELVRFYSCRECAAKGNSRSDPPECRREFACRAPPSRHAILIGRALSGRRAS